MRTVADVMTREVVTATGSTPFKELVRLLHEHHVSALPVVDEDRRPVGVVSRSDLLRVFLRPDADIREEVLCSVIRDALWLDPAAFRVEVDAGRVRLEGTLERRSLVPVLVQLVSQVDGVVGVESRLGWQVDDLAGRPAIPTPWGVNVR